MFNFEGLQTLGQGLRVYDDFLLLKRDHQGDQEGLNIDKKGSYLGDSHFVGGRVAG